MAVSKLSDYQYEFVGDKVRDYECLLCQHITKDVLPHLGLIQIATPQETGYQCEFVENVKDYECPVCLHVTREPNLTSCCGQHFCHYCIQTMLTNSKSCPLCKNTSFTVFLDKKHNRTILDLKVHCDKKEYCHWTGSLREFKQDHSKKCKYALVNCSNNCGKTILRAFLRHHKSTCCPKRLHSCEYCQLKGTYQDIQEDHVPVCPKYPVTCPNECGEGHMKREQLKQHLEECPLVIVEGELREVGCEEKVQRKDLDRHMEEAAQKHLKLSTRYFLKNQKRQDKEIATLRQENEKFRRYLTTMVQASLIPKNINLLVNYEQLDLQSYCKHDKTFQTLSGYKMEIHLWKIGTTLDIGLNRAESTISDILKRPKVFSIKAIRLLNQAGDHGHHEAKRDSFQVTNGSSNDKVHIRQEVIENPPPGVQYIVNGHIKMEITVVEN